MELPVFGRVSDPETLETEPIIAPIVGYTHDGQEVLERFPFKPRTPIGVMALVARSAGPSGELPLNVLLLCLSDCLMPDARERWQAFLDNEKHTVDLKTLADLCEALFERYGQRPTRRSSGSSPTGRRSGRTSKAAASSEA